MIQVNMEKALKSAHNARREARLKLFKPLDVKATIPSEADQAEADRAAIRAEDAILQTSMDNAVTADDLKNLIPELDEGSLLIP